MEAQMGDVISLPRSPEQKAANFYGLLGPQEGRREKTRWEKVLSPSGMETVASAKDP